MNNKIKNEIIIIINNLSEINLLRLSSFAKGLLKNEEQNKKHAKINNRPDCLYYLHAMS